jgi:hypothetical protein
MNQASTIKGFKALSKTLDRDVLVANGRAENHESSLMVFHELPRLKSNISLLKVLLTPSDADACSAGTCLGHACVYQVDIC